jgi:hypothetical protein
MIVCLFSNIQIAVAVLKTSASFVASNLHISIIPFLGLLFMLIFTLAWIVDALFLVSSGEVIAVTGGT